MHARADNSSFPAECPEPTETFCSFLAQLLISLCTAVLLDKNPYLAQPKPFSGEAEDMDFFWWLFWIEGLPSPPKYFLWDFIQALHNFNKWEADMLEGLNLDSNNSLQGSYLKRLKYWLIFIRYLPLKAAKWDTNLRMRAQSAPESAKRNTQTRHRHACYKRAHGLRTGS